MKKLLLSAAVMLGAAGILCGQNIIKNNDFNSHEKNLGPEFRTNGGKAVLYTENATWNRCGQLIADKIRKSGKDDVLSASVWIGGSYKNNNQPGGFVCKPNTTYDFSIDIRGTTPAASIKMTTWNKNQKLWYGKTGPTTLGGFKISQEWQTFKGSFTTRADSTHAALTLSIWEHSRWGKLKSKPGDYVLFDNIIIKERKRPALNSAKGGTTAVEMNLRKVIPADGTVYSDFHRFKSAKPLTAKTSFSLKMTDTAFVLDFECEEPLKITYPKANASSLWSGDVLEIFFGPKKTDRAYSQFVVSPDGKTYCRLQDNGTPLKMDVKTRKTAKGWGGTATIAYSELGWEKPAAGDTIIFNIARQRVAAKELSSWGKVTEGFSDLRNCGLIYCGSFDGVARSDFELKLAKKDAEERQAKLDKFRSAKMLYAPVKVTDDFSIPYLPDALFNPVEKLELTAAVNELKPMPFALLNNTDKTMYYQVTIELPPENPKALPWHNGKLFPGVTYRQAMQIRDNPTGKTAIYDPLVQLNEARMFSIAAGECALLWFDFNTTGMKPGEYNGRLRILPLTGRGVFTKRGYGFGNNNYDGDMTDIPLTLTVRDIVLPKEPARPAAYFAPPANDATAKMLAEAGMRVFQINPWSLNLPLKNGKFELVAPKAEANLKLLKRNGYDRLWIGYSCVHVFQQHYGKKNLKLFPQWIKAIEDFLVLQGFDPAKAFVELYDEPSKNFYTQIDEILKATKAIGTKLKLSITLGAHIMPAETMKRFAPYVDDWVLWRSGYFSNPKHLEFIRSEQKRGVTFSHYTCHTSIRSPLDKNFRRNAWFGEYRNLEYNNMYQAIDGVRNAHFKSNGGNAFVYIAHGVPVPSIRYMAVRQGIMDVRYLEMLRAIGKDNAEAQAFLKTAARRVVVDKAHDPNESDKVREEAAQLIMKIQKK